MAARHISVRVPEQLTLPTAAIEGIGVRVAADLKRLEIYTVGDLLRVEPGRLRDALSTRRPLEAVRAWCQMAAFLQIAGTTPHWALALQNAGLATVADFRARDLPGLRKLFKAAQEDGLIRDVPTAAAMSEMLREAAVIELTGALNGTILDADDRPVQDATVRVGKEQEVTDARGRFRIIRIPLWATSTLAVSHPGYRPARFRLRQVQQSTFPGSQIFRVRPVPANRPASSRVLMEVRGDSLPPVGDARISIREVEPGELVERDLLALNEFSADGERARLVSKLLVYEDGEYWLPYVWVPVSELKRGAKAGDCYVLRGGAYEEIEMNALKLRGWPKMLRTMRRMGEPPTGVDEIEEYLKKGAELMRRAAERRERF